VERGKVTAAVLVAATAGVLVCGVAADAGDEPPEILGDESITLHVGKPVTVDVVAKERLRFSVVGDPGVSVRCADPPLATGICAARAGLVRLVVDLTSPTPGTRELGAIICVDSPGLTGIQPY
jgi:hypothetical protein